MQQKKNIALLVVCLLVIAGAAAMGFHFKQAAEVPVGGAAQPESTVSSVDPSPQEDPGQSADNGAIAPKNEIFSDYMEQANQKLSTMTLEERVGQVFLARYPGEADAAEQIKTLHPGGYVLFANDFKDKTKTNVKQELKNCQSVSEIPLILGVDEEGGTVVRVSSNTEFVQPRGDGRSAGGYPAEIPVTIGTRAQSELGPGGGCFHRPQRLYLFPQFWDERSADCGICGKCGHGDEQRKPVRRAETFSGLW